MSEERVAGAVSYPLPTADALTPTFLCQSEKQRTRFFGDALTGGALRKRTEELYDVATVRIERTAETLRSSGEILTPRNLAQRRRGALGS